MPRSKTLVLDANLLLLLVIGAMDRSAITRFKRTQQFTVEDFDALVDIVSRADRIVTTPHILTEVSNLANSLRDDQRNEFAGTFRGVISKLEERWKTADSLSQHDLFPFGISDVAAFSESTNAILLTEDGRFAAQVNARGGLAFSLRVAIALGKEL